jgi:hypothetical protein
VAPLAAAEARSDRGAMPRQLTFIAFTRRVAC